jgi:hypothetical protein
MGHKAQGKPLEQPQLQCPATLSCFMSCCPEARETILIQLLRNFDDTATYLFDFCPGCHNYEVPVTLWSKVTRSVPASEFGMISCKRSPWSLVFWLPSWKLLLLTKPFSQSPMCELQAARPGNCAFTFYAERGEDMPLLLFSQSSAFSFEEMGQQQKRTVKFAISDCPHNQERFRNLSGGNTDKLGMPHLTYGPGRRVCPGSDSKYSLWRYQSFQHWPFEDQLIRTQRIANGWISIAREAVHDDELCQPKVSTNKPWLTTPTGIVTPL